MGLIFVFADGLIRRRRVPDCAFLDQRTDLGKAALVCCEVALHRFDVLLIFGLRCDGIEVVQALLKMVALLRPLGEIVRLLFLVSDVEKEILLVTAQVSRVGAGASGVLRQFGVALQHIDGFMRDL